MVSEGRESRKDQGKWNPARLDIEPGGWEMGAYFSIR